MNEPLDISVIILTFNEELHIRRCLENARLFAREIFVVDCFSTDQTVAIAESLGAKVVQHAWQNNHAMQFNWALKSLPVQTEWVLRLDADEYLFPETIAELQNNLLTFIEPINGIVLPLRRVFLGRHIKSCDGIMLLRIFRRGCGYCECRWMDEHIQLTGKTTVFKNGFVDDNLNDLSWWTQKHIKYAIREAADLLMLEFGRGGEHSDQSSLGSLSNQADAKRRKKYKYVKLPLFWRSFFYFCYRYFWKFGFLDGKEGFLWHFLQGWWYRAFVDAKIFELKKNCGNDWNAICNELKNKYQLHLDATKQPDTETHSGSKS